MATSDAARGPPQSSRRTTATSGARPRVPSSRAEETYLDGTAEVRPQDSASNAPHRRAPSASHRRNGPLRSVDRRVEKTTVTTTAKVQIRTRSPMKLSASDQTMSTSPVPRGTAKATYRPVGDEESLPQKTKKRAIRKSATLIIPFKCLINISLQRHGFLRLPLLLIQRLHLPAVFPSQH